MKYYAHYEAIYKSLHRRGEALEPSNDSLVDFLKCEGKRFLPITVADHASVIEFGAGPGSVFLQYPAFHWSVTAVDISSFAIEKARERAKDFGRENIEHQVMDACESSFDQEFHMAVDGHLLHCLVGAAERAQYLKNVFRALRPGGRFFLETMVACSNFAASEEQLFQEGILFQEAQADESLEGLVWSEDRWYFPFRRIARAHEVEEEIKSAGFEINFLMVHAHKKFIPHSKRSVPLPTDPDLMRVVCTRN